MFGQQIPPMPMQNMPHQQPNPAAVNSLAALASLGSMGKNTLSLSILSWDYVIYIDL